MTWTRAALCRTLMGIAAAWLVACVAEVPTSSQCADGGCDGIIDAVRCFCPDVYQPVCGTNGQTFGNQCEARCKRAPIAHEGECKAEPDPGPAPGADAGTVPSVDAGPAPSVDAGPTKPPEPDPGCVCPAVYKPVCGADGKTYGNSCEASCAKVPVASEGQCIDPGCICPAVYQPVCGADGKTYGNSCEAGCRKVPVASEGECAGGGSPRACKSNADCTKGNICDPATRVCQPECTINCLVYDPVCGADGKTYGCGKADAHCHGVEVVSAGECPATNPPCACTKEYAPVCGNDGKTYGNTCMLKCAGVGLAYEGACKSSGPVTCSYGGKVYKEGEAFPATDGCNRCSCGPDGLVACTLRACACDYSASDRTWAAKSPDQCKLVKFACPSGKRPFFNDCGCGCEPEPTTACKVGGCSGQLCVGPGQPDGSTCEWRPEYACYKTASCGVQADGRCGWKQTEELKKCLESAK